MDCNRTIDTCADCGAAIHGDDNASAFGDNLNVCDDCESKREATAERHGCAHCGMTLGIDCGDAEPDYDDRHCSEGCYKAAHMSSKIKRPAEKCRTCDGSRIATGHYRAACINPWCTGPMFIACPACAGLPFSVELGCNFAGDCSPKGVL